MTLRGYMDVITRTTFHLQVRIRSETDDQAETGPDRGVPTPGRNRPRKHVHTDSMSFSEFHLSMNFTSTGSRTKVSGMTAHIVTQQGTLATLLGPYLCPAERYWSTLHNISISSQVSQRLLAQSILT